VYVRNTSRYPSDDVLRLVLFATANVDMRRVCVNVKNSHRYACGGYAYLGVPEISNAPPSSEFLITIRLGAAQRFPTQLPHTKRSGPRRLSCWREGLVAIAAHEAKHIEQYRHDRPRSEVECERFEAEVLDRYRVSDLVT
jgi:hypothetical protein